ncbi:MAG: hypothetical protein GXP40_01120 [Chloroflexi bacterium]|nr:hypothetical protein [Chloroflexota bacterium]
MRSLKFPQKSIPIAFFILTILAYGLLIPWLGFYWDDWPFAWIAHFLGPAEFIPAFRPFRPFLGPIFLVTTSILPESPLYWQAFGIIIRFLSALAAWWSLRKIWPDNIRSVLTVSLLFLVFPGYSQQWVALTHINQEWMSLIAYLLSFGLTASAIREPGKFRVSTTLALLLLFWGVFPTEYFIGFEPLRFLIIWFLIAEKIHGFWPRLKRVVKLWSPYFLLWAANALWLSFYYTAGGYDSYDVTAGQPSGNMFLQLIREMGDALYKTGGYVWVQVLGQFARTPTAPSTLLGIGLVIVCFVLAAIYLTRLDLSSTANNPGKWAVQAVILGTAGILLGRLPSFAAGLPLKLQTTYDRFTISMMFGASLFLAGLLELLLKNKKLRVTVISLIVALAAGQQFMNANVFRHDWTRQRELAWQLSWRIPDMKQGTLLLTHQLPMDYESDLSFTAPLNWIYAPDFTPAEDMPYALLNTEKRLGGPTLPELKRDIPILIPYRTVTFHGSTSEAIVIYFPPSGCLRVLDPLYANSATYKNQSSYLTDAIFLSDPSRILTNAPPPTMPKPLFGTEPTHSWCYYYTKAELARQVGDWEKVTALGEEAASQGYSPTDPYEWLPFIEGYAYTGSSDIAEELSRKAFEKEPKIRKGLCILWERTMINATDHLTKKAAVRLKTEFKCNP